MAWLSLKDMTLCFTGETGLVRPSCLISCDFQTVLDIVNGLDVQCTCDRFSASFELDGHHKFANSSCVFLTLRFVNVLLVGYFEEVQRSSRHFCHQAARSVQ